MQTTQPLNINGKLPDLALPVLLDLFSEYLSLDYTRSARGAVEVHNNCIIALTLYFDAVFGF